MIKLLKNSGEKNIAEELGIAPFIVKKLSYACDKYTEEELKQIIYAFDDYDKKTKNGDMDFEIGLKKIICML
jgi:DNA polymerase III delta subunit